jgi:hypothetical protein
MPTFCAVVLYLTKSLVIGLWFVIVPLKGTVKQNGFKAFPYFVFKKRIWMKN